jgi:hypothetical protein
MLAHSVATALDGSLHCRMAHVVTFLRHDDEPPGLSACQETFTLGRCRLHIQDHRISQAYGRNGGGVVEECVGRAAICAAAADLNLEPVAIAVSDISTVKGHTRPRESTPARSHGRLCVTTYSAQPS